MKNGVNNLHNMKFIELMLMSLPRCSPFHSLERGICLPAYGPYTLSPAVLPNTIIEHKIPTINVVLHLLLYLYSRNDLYHLRLLHTQINTIMVEL